MQVQGVATVLPVDDLEAAVHAFEALLSVAPTFVTAGEVEEGPHELRITAEGPGGWPLVLYTPKPS
jgi:hypothetical protein